MPTVYFEAENRKVEVPEGTTLRKAASRAGVSVYGSVNKVLNCRGFGLCGTDQIKVSPDDCINEPTMFERLQLGKKSDMRLACQVKVNGDCKVNTAPAIEYGIEMADNVKFGSLAFIFGALTLFTIIFMLFEMIGKPLF